jgi:hypothetical protein
LFELMIFRCFFFHVCHGWRHISRLHSAIFAFRPRRHYCLHDPITADIAFIFAVFS